MKFDMRKYAQVHLENGQWYIYIYPKRLPTGEYKAIHLEEANREEVLVTPGLRHCSNKYELAREGEKEGLFLLIPYNAAEVLEQRKYYHSQDKAAI